MRNNTSLHQTGVKNIGWRVVFAGLGINLALGILYTWSVISSGVPEQWGWSQSDKALPYSVACLVFCLIMVPAGRMQDKISPRFVATLGGILVGLGMVLAGFTTSPVGYMIGFGILSGAGIGFGYASKTPPAVKWFPSAKTGLIAGIVVVGFILEGMRIAMTANPPGSIYAFIGYGASALFSGNSALNQWYGYILYLHAILTGAFVAYLPFSQLLHIIIAPVILPLGAVSEQRHE